jgi:signal transduction histidine kinase/ActR/RegA family two-component response regulator
VRPLTQQKPLTLLNRSLAVATVLAALMVGAVLWFGARNSSEDAYVLHSLQVRDQLIRALSLVQSGETGQRGYLLTGRDFYLGPYNNAMAQLPPMLDRLSALVADNPQQGQKVIRLRELVKEKFDELKSTLDAFNAGRKDQALAIVNNDDGFRLMMEIRRTVTSMQEDEDKLLAARQESAARTGALVQIGAGASFLLICIVGFLIARYTRESVARISSARDQLLVTNQELVEQIARRELVESQLRQSQKMEAIGQLTGGIAHDFNNMLGVIMGAHDLISRRIKKGDFGIQRFLDAAISAAERAAILTQRLLAFARQQPLEPQPIDANKMIVNMSDLLKSTLGENIQIETVPAAALWTVNADAQQLESAILNIAINGRDAMPEGGKLTIETANSYLDEAYCRQNPEIAPGEFVLVAVTDTGTGIPADVIARVFDPFFTTKPTGKGTGLGLSQVYGFVKQSKGHIKIYSEPNAGTTVKIYLPRIVGDANEIRTAAVKPMQTGDRSETILVVEDDPLMCKLTCDALAELGYTILQAASAAEALAILDQQSNIKLLFTDVVMPDVNGKKLAEEALRRRPDLKVLYTTGYTANAVVHGGVLDAGVQFITKPFTLDQLAAKVRTALDE